jgi:F-type H+-transporting ATPase subunit b
MRSPRFFRVPARLLLAGALLTWPLTWAVAQPAAEAPAAAAQPAAEAPAAAAPTAPAAGEAPSPAPAAAAEPVHEPVHAEPNHAEPAAAQAHGATAEAHVAEGVHGDGEGHGEGHGEAGPLIENWWSWDYGAGKSHHHPPFGFALINFVVFLFLLNKLAGKDLRAFIIARHTEVRKALDRAREVEAKAQEQLRQFEERTKSLDAEIEALLAGFRKQAESERHNIIARAENDAQKLLRDAESQVQVAIESAKRDLERKAGLLAVDLAEKLIVSRITDADQHKLVDRYVTQVEALAAKSGAHTEGHT